MSKLCSWNAEISSYKHKRLNITESHIYCHFHPDPKSAVSRANTSWKMRPGRSGRPSRGFHRRLIQARTPSDPEHQEPQPAGRRGCSTRPVSMSATTIKSLLWAVSLCADFFPYHCPDEMCIHSWMRRRLTKLTSVKGQSRRTSSVFTPRTGCLHWFLPLTCSQQSQT